MSTINAQESARNDDQGTMEAWLETGRQIAKEGAGYHFRVGDWLCNAKGLDEKSAYREAEVITGIRRNMLYGLAWVSSRVPVCIRTQSLSWSHHRQVAHLEAEKQREWLGKAAAEDWSVRQLHEFVKQPRNRDNSQGQKAKKMLVRLTDAQQDLVRWYAKARGVSASAFLQQVIEDWYQQAALETKQQAQATAVLQ